MLDESTTEDTASATAAIDDLVTDAMGSEPSAPEPASAEAASTTDAPASEPAATQDLNQQSAPDPAVAAPQPNAPVAAPQPQTYQIGDRQYSISELQAALTSAQQLPHLQRKYVDMLEQRASQPAQQPQGQMPQQDPQSVLRNIRATYDSKVQEAVKQGLIEPDFAHLFPGMAAQMLMYRDGFTNMANQLGAMQTQAAQQAQAQQSQGLMQDIGRSLGQLAASGEAFAPLKDQKVVNGFFQYLYNMNPQVGQMKDPSFLAGQWVAYNKDQYLQAQQAAAANAARANQVRYARADATTPTRAPGVMSAPQMTPLDEMTNEFWQRTQ